MHTHVLNWACFTPTSLFVGGVIIFDISLNAGRYLVVFDSSAEEGGGPSAPLAEWLSEVQRNRMWNDMRDAPTFLASSMYEGDCTTVYGLCGKKGTAVG